MRKKLREWFYEDVRKVQAGRHAPQMPRFVPSLILLLLLTLIGLWLVFASFARLTVGSSVSFWWPKPGSVPKDQLFNIVRSTVTAAGVFAGLFAIVYAYRKQRVEEAAGRRLDEEGLSQRYQDAATQLGSERTAIRLAGVYSLARLADEWPEQRQVCVDVLCAYVRMAWNGQDLDEHLIRTSIYTVIEQHLKRSANPSWSGLKFDFSGALLVDMMLPLAVFEDGAHFRGATFQGLCTLVGAKFRGAANFTNAQILGHLDLNYIEVGDSLALQGVAVQGNLHLSVKTFAEHAHVNIDRARISKGGKLRVALLRANGSRGRISADNIAIERHGVAVIRGDTKLPPPRNLPEVSALGWTGSRHGAAVDRALVRDGDVKWEMPSVQKRHWVSARRGQ